MFQRIKRENERGSSAIFLLIIMTIILFSAALVIDVGLVVVNKQQLKAAADAAALAGASVIIQGEDAARLKAEEFARENGLTTWTINVNTDLKQVKVGTNKTVSLFFAPLFGLGQQTIEVESAAQVGTIIGGEGFTPLGVQEQEYTYGQSYQLKFGGGSGYQGYYGPLAFGGTGSANYSKNLMYGYSGYVEIGMQVLTENGNMSGPTQDGINYRILQDESKSQCQSFLTVDKDCKRLIYTPIVNPLDIAGHSRMEIVGFAAFYLEDFQGSGNDSFVVGRFIERIGLGDVSFNPEQKSFGLVSVKLVQ